jgi:hypothetical protein
MNSRGSARICLLAAAMSIASVGKAGVWGTQPVLGVSGDYSSNPALLDLPDTAETHAALLLDAPTTYVDNAFKVSFLPSFRLSNSRGYSSLDSDYEHLNVRGEFDTDLSVFTATGGVARDSSLYHDYLLSGSTGVRRDTATADLNWDRQLTERLEVNTDLNSMRVRYAQAAGISTLIDYKYTSLTPTLAWAQTERLKFTVSANGGRYDSLNGQTESTSASLQLGFTKQLNEIWSLSASAGDSRANNDLHTDQEEIEFNPQSGLFFVLVPITVKSTQNGSVYSVNLSRQAQLLLLSAVASRQLTPTGFAFLSRQDNYELKATYNPSERWTLSGDAHRVKYQQPEYTGAIIDINVTYLQLSAAWQWTEHWTLTMNASRVMERFGAPDVGVASSGVSVEFSRQFNWKQFQ